jgi:nicotinamide/nicotinate riboside kinase
MVIGIGGVSRSGKSTLAAQIFSFFTDGGQTAVVLTQDDYVFPMEQIPAIQNDDEVETDWEIPESIDFPRYKAAILAAQNEYDHVITEGLLNFYDADINALFDKFFFVDISKTTFLRRKDADKRWGEVPKWYVEHIWTSYERLGRTVFEDEKREVIVVSGEDGSDGACSVRVAFDNDKSQIC